MRKMLDFGEVRVQRLVELARRGQVAPEGLLDHDARVLRAAGGAQVLDHHREHARRDRQVVQRPLARRPSACCSASKVLRSL